MLHLDLAWQKYSKSVKKYQTPFKKFLFVDLCYQKSIYSVHCSLGFPDHGLGDGNLTL